MTQLQSADHDAGESIAEQTLAVQLAYPQIWFACHRAHQTRGNSVDVTDHEAGILAHIAAIPGLMPGHLAAHLGIGRPALSAQLKRLSGLGLITMTPAKDARSKSIALSDLGQALVSERSPLATNQVKALLSMLSVPQRKAAVAGLALLASAAQSMGKSHSKDN
jgi:DNA-binding MarR family transcriptional regulator